MLVPALKALLLVPATLLPIINPLSTAPVFVATVGSNRELATKLARQVAKRFQTMAAPANSFVLALEGDGKSRHVVWRSVKDGKPTVYETEPGEDRLRGFKVDLLALLPIEGLL